MQGNHSILEIRVVLSTQGAVSFLPSKLDSALEAEGYQLRAWTLTPETVKSTIAYLVAVRRNKNLPTNVSEALSQVRDKTKQGLNWTFLGTYSDKEVCDKVYASLLQSPRYAPTKDSLCK